MACMKKMAEMDERRVREFISAEDEIFTAYSVPYEAVPMTGNRYQVKAMRTCSINDNEKDKLLHGVFGLNAEAGEADVINKLEEVFRLEPGELQEAK